MGIMVYSLFMGNAGFISSTVTLNPKHLILELPPKDGEREAVSRHLEWLTQLVRQVLALK